MRVTLRRWTMLGLSGAALGGVFAACGELESPKIVITDSLGGLGGTDGLGGSDGLGGFGGEAPILPDPPLVVGVTPANEADDAEPSDKVVVEFSEALDPSSVTEDSVYVLDGDEKVPGTLTYSSGHVVFTPSSPLSLLTTYTVHVTTGVRDTTDTALVEAFSSSFVTRDGAFEPEVVFHEQDIWLRPSKPDAQGNVMIAWSEYNGSVGDIYVAHISPNGDVGEKKLIEDLDTSCSAPAIAMSPEGDAVVAWVNTTGAGQEIWARRYIDGAWEASAHRVETVFDADNNYEDGPFVGVSKGAFTVGWTRSTIYQTAVLSYLEFTKATGAGDWSDPPFIIDAGNTSATDASRIRGGVSLDFGPDGGGTLVYSIDANGTVLTMRSAFYSASTGKWSVGGVLRPTEVLSTQQYCGSCGPLVRRNAAGNALVVWSKRDEGGTEINLWASYYDKANGWGAPMPVDQAEGDAFVYEGGMANFGNHFAVTWKQNNQTIFSPLVSVYDVEDKTWTEPKLLSDGENSNYYDGPKIVADDHGNLMAAWSQGGDLDLPPTVHYARFNQLDGTWAAPTSLVQIDQSYSGVQLVGLGAGPVYAFLRQYWDYSAEPDPGYPYLAVFE